MPENYILKIGYNKRSCHFLKEPVMYHLISKD